MISRRWFLRGVAGAALMAGAPVLWARRLRAEELPAPTVELLGASEFVYVSPLKGDGS